MVWEIFLNNKNNYLLRDQKIKNKMIHRLAKREGEIQKEKEREELRVDMETDMDVYLAFEESYLPT